MIIEIIVMMNNNHDIIYIRSLKEKFCDTLQRKSTQF